VNPSSFAMNITSGIKLLDEHEGAGKPAEKGDRVIYNVKIFLNRGDEVPLNELQVNRVPAHRVRTEGAYAFVDHWITLGKREAIAGVERTLTGMKVGGYRKVRVSPHRAYREAGLPGLIPENAVLVLEVWLREISEHP